MLKETNLVQISELTHSLSRAQITALQAENAKIQMEFRIRDLEAVVSSQNRAIEILQVPMQVHINLLTVCRFAFQLDGQAAVP